MPQPLPLEIHLLVIRNVVDQTTLWSLVLCCSAFRDETQRFLFQNVEPTSFSRQKQFLAVINAEPLRFGPMVHAFQVDDWGARDDDRVVALVKALQAMCNLEHLKLSWWMPSTILRECTFKLRTLVCTFALHATQVSFLLCNFLPTQPCIERLEIHLDKLIDVSIAPKDLCPRLKSLGVDRHSVAGVFLRDACLIPHFQWFNGRSPPPLTIRQLNHLKSLSFLANMDTTFTQHLTSLVDLKLDISISDANNLLPYLRFLRNIPHLQVLSLDLMSPYSRTSDDEFYPAFSAPFQRAFDLCPILEYINIKHDYPGAKYTRLARPTIREDGTLVWKRRSVRSDEVMDWRFDP